MDDLISRQAAIEVVKHAWAKGLEPTQYLEELPAVQTCEDAVSRADVLETYADLYDVFEDSRAICKELHKVYDRINALPSVQPEPKPDKNGSEPFGNAEMLSDRTTDDCISRQAAIKTLEKGLPSEPLKSKYTEGITVGFGLAITWIKQLPAV